tara:strand:- start:128 stop:946 length:819 start_codon:yes stop_codon:yes gene_type:complete
VPKKIYKKKCEYKFTPEESERLDLPKKQPGNYGRSWKHTESIFIEHVNKSTKELISIEETSWYGHKCRKNIEITRGSPPFCSEHNREEVVNEWEKQKKLKRDYKKYSHLKVSSFSSSMPKDDGIVRQNIGNKAEKDSNRPLRCPKCGSDNTKLARTVSAEGTSTGINSTQVIGRTKTTTFTQSRMAQAASFERPTSGGFMTFILTFALFTFFSFVIFSLNLNLFAEFILIGLSFFGSYLIATAILDTGVERDMRSYNDYTKMRFCMDCMHKY